MLKSLISDIAINSVNHLKEEEVIVAEIAY